MIKTAILGQKIKQYFLWGGLLAMSVPTVPLRAAVALSNALDSVGRLLKYGYRLSPKPPGHECTCAHHKSEMTSLADDHPLKLWADETAQAEGLAGTHITYEHAEKGMLVRNAQVYFASNKANIRFFGDPESDDQEFVKAVIAHELGHHKNSHSIEFSKHAMNTTSAYAVMAEYGALGALLAHGLESVREHPLVQMVPPALITNLPSASNWLMLSAMSVIALPIVAGLTQKFSNCEEHLADMKSAEIMGPHKAVALYTELDDREKARKMAHAEHDKWLRDSRKLDVNDLSLVKSWLSTLNQILKPMHQAHPPAEARVEFIRKAYGLESRGVPADGTARVARNIHNPPQKDLF